MTEISKKTDLKLKLLALDIAAREMIDQTGSLDMDKLFNRARLIYDRANDNAIFDWKSPFRKEEKVEKPEEKPKEQEKVEIKNVPDGMKQCPKCAEIIPTSWTVHKFKQDGSECGQTFQ